MHLKESEGNTSAVGVFTYFPYALVYYTILRDTVKIIKDVMHHACRSFNQVQHTQFDIGRVYDVCLVHRGEKNTGQGYTTLSWLFDSIKFKFKFKILFEECFNISIRDMTNFILKP